MTEDIRANIIKTIGRTPLVRLNRIAEGLTSELIVKLESANPGGSVKDRIGIAMIELAESQGLLRPGGTIIEATAGNTGVGLALAAAVKGYRTIFVLPDKMSSEKVNLLKAYGAEIVITRADVPATHPDYYVNRAKSIASSIPGSFVPNQFFNKANPEAHYRTTGLEIWEQTGGRLDYFVAGIGTGGTITGIARFLKEKDTATNTLGVDPDGSVYRGFKETGVLPAPRSYKVEGIGEEFIPSTVNLDLVDEIVTVSDADAFQTARALARKEGILTGGSGGAAVFATLQLARRIEEAHEAKRIVTLLPDTGRNYLSKIYSDEWMEANGFVQEGSKRR